MGLGEFPVKLSWDLHTDTAKISRISAIIWHMKSITILYDIGWNMTHAHEINGSSYPSCLQILSRNLTVIWLHKFNMIKTDRPRNLVSCQNICLGHMSIDRWFGCCHGPSNQPEDGKLRRKIPLCAVHQTHSNLAGCTLLNSEVLSSTFLIKLINQNVLPSGFLGHISQVMLRFSCGRSEVSITGGCSLHHRGILHPSSPSNRTWAKIWCQIAAKPSLMFLQITIKWC